MSKKKVSVASRIRLVSLVLCIIFMFGLSTGGSFASGTVIEISTAEELKNISKNLKGSYELKNNIDISGEKWIPIGTDPAPFSGILDGNGYEIKGLNISPTFTGSWCGLFGKMTGGKVHDLSIQTIRISRSTSAFGSVAGYALNSHIENVQVEDLEAEVGGYCGGVVGRSENTEIRKVSVVGPGKVKGNYAGGIIGRAENVNLVETFSNASLEANSEAGGLAAMSFNCKIRDSYSSAKVIIAKVSGGLVGSSSNVLTTIDNSYFSGTVLSKNLIGLRTATVKNTYFDSAAMGIGTPIEQARSTEALKDKATYIGWDFDTIWKIEEGQYPTLRFQSTNEPGSEDENINGKVKYKYDKAGRLIEAEYESGKIVKYTYDKAGNLLKKEVVN